MSTIEKTIKDKIGNLNVRLINAKNSEERSLIYYELRALKEILETAAATKTKKMVDTED